ncbi:gliding motility-associated C-terminal domain-containing protein [Mucilaginibacter myungsuensis]|uniref:Gliding motility-associated C-terminal domain-containing protein n=1 Tax=Mucilaginibacter myungsuensis TaxID=649104 RepID=A0A929KZR3_9SPHI|nr:gliding motility-associated C-terminal domain-containing protein [Mucilaginibacter myungsuensis]MBE9663602.1 gliding motility-associated C-terminal domain-containing protein [Mucilaginibacter myungsuensis]MDN3599074.1 gliding motility-associated C-terminal domain-containing protein [Mucilaginibacter myungsuensis]
MMMLSVCLSFGELFGQSFYVTDRNRKIHTVTIVNGQITQDLPVTSCSGSPESIAFSKNTIYYLEERNLYRADLVDGAFVNCSLLEGLQIFNSMTIGKNGLLYLLSNNQTLYTYDPKTPRSLKQVGTSRVPTQPSGDLVFYKDELYYASLAGIYKVNLQDPAQSVNVIPYNNRYILGLISISVNSTTNKIYGFEADNNFVTTTVIELDLDNYQIGNIAGVLQYYVYDAASNVEDGSYLTLNIDDIKTTPDCPYTGRGTVQVISNNATLNYQFTLGTETNNTGIFRNVAPGPYTVTVRNGSESKQTPMTVPPFVFAKPTLTLNKTEPKCLTKGSISFATTANADAMRYSILYNNQSYPLAHTFTDLAAGPHRFEIKNQGGCTVDTYNETLVQQTCEIILDSAIVKQDCSDPKKGSARAYTSPGNDRYHYSLNGGPPNTTGIFENIAVGNHNIRITSDGGGSRNVPISIQDLSANDPTVTVQKQDATCRVTASVKFDISASDKTGYTVVYKSLSYPLTHSFNIIDTGSHTFSILKPGGCLLKTEIVNIIKSECQTVFFPNTFTPNNDGVNDVFRPNEGTVVANLQLNIYNRLGAMIYTSNKAANGWDGQYQGKAAPAGVYYWIATYINDDGLNTTQNGSITLIR